MQFLNFKHRKLNLRVFLAGCTVAMVTYCVTEVIMFLPILGQFFDTMIITSTDKEWL